MASRARGDRTAALLACAIVSACGRIGFAPTTAAPLDAASIDADADANAGLMAIYPMDVVAGGGVVPALPAVYSGTCVEPECPVAVPGGGYLFDGTMRFVLAPELARCIDRVPFTIAVWMLAVPGTSDATLLAEPYSASSDADVAALLVLQGTTDLTFETTTDGTEHTYLPSMIDVEDGAWHHAAISWDGTVKRIYIDGQLAGEGAAVLAGSTGASIVVGNDLDGGAVIHPFTGMLHDLRLYGRALGADEIAGLLVARRPVTVPPRRGP
jgi:Concanavalin A-like lectin/glucanases superfamily